MTFDEVKDALRACKGILSEESQEQRLQQLLEEFEAARMIVYSEGALRSANPSRYYVPCDPDRVVEEWEPFTLNDVEFMYKAKLYIIARDFGEFDPQRALMLWKLQNSN